MFAVEVERAEIEQNLFPISLIGTTMQDSR